MILLTEISVKQALQRLAVPGLVPCHLMHGVMDGVQVQGLGALGQVGLAGGDSASRCLGRAGENALFTGIIGHSSCFVKVSTGKHLANIFSTSLVQQLYFSKASSKHV